MHMNAAAKGYEIALAKALSAHAAIDAARNSGKRYDRLLARAKVADADLDRCRSRMQARQINA